MLFAGDAYKHANPTADQREVFESQMKRILDARIPLVAITGNHDSTSIAGVTSAIQSLSTLANAHVIDTPQILSLRTRHGNLVVACMPWVTRKMVLRDTKSATTQEDFLAATQRYLCDQLHLLNMNAGLEEGTHVLLGHLDVDTAQYSSEQTMILKNTVVVPIDTISRLDAFAYIALGHVHKHQHLHKTGKCPVVYAGSIDRIDFSEKQEAKGFCLMTLEDNLCQQVEFIQTPTRDFEEIMLDIRGMTDIQGYIEHALQSRDDIRDAVVKLTYLTDVGVSVNLNAVMELLSSAHYVDIVHQKHVVSKETVVANTILTAETPLDALREYIQQHPQYKDYAKELVSLATEYANV